MLTVKYTKKNPFDSKERYSSIEFKQKQFTPLQPEEWEKLKACLKKKKYLTDILFENVSLKEALNHDLKTLLISQPCLIELKWKGIGRVKTQDLLNLLATLKEDFHTLILTDLDIDKPTDEEIELLIHELCRLKLISLTLSDTKLQRPLLKRILGSMSHCHKIEITQDKSIRDNSVYFTREETCDIFRQNPNLTQLILNEIKTFLQNRKQTPYKSQLDKVNPLLEKNEVISTLYIPQPTSVTEITNNITFLNSFIIMIFSDPHFNIINLTLIDATQNKLNQLKKSSYNNDSTLNSIDRLLTFLSKSSLCIDSYKKRVFNPNLKSYSINQASESDFLKDKHNELTAYLKRKRTIYLMQKKSSRPFTVYEKMISTFSSIYDKIQSFLSSIYNKITSLFSSNTSKSQMKHPYEIVHKHHDRTMENYSRLPALINSSDPYYQFITGVILLSFSLIIRNLDTQKEKEIFFDNLKKHLEDFFEMRLITPSMQETKFEFHQFILELFRGILTTPIKNNKRQPGIYFQTEDGSFIFTDFSIRSDSNTVYQSNSGEDLYRYALPYETILFFSYISDKKMLSLDPPYQIDFNNIEFFQHPQGKDLKYLSPLSTIQLFSPLHLEELNQDIALEAPHLTAFNDFLHKRNQQARFGYLNQSKLSIQLGRAKDSIEEAELLSTIKQTPCASQSEKKNFIDNLSKKVSPNNYKFFTANTKEQTNRKINSLPLHLK